MTQQTPNVTPENEQPIIPSWIFPLIIAVGLIVAAFNASQPGGMTVVGYAGIGFAILAFVGWVLTAPQQITGMLRGRTMRYGGASIFVTLLVIAAIVVAYVFVRDQELRIDLTESDEFSLTEESRDAIANIGADPTIPAISINVFYTAIQATLQDRYAPLFDDYQTTSSGKITYQFIDPERSPTTADAYGVTRAGQIVVTVMDEAGNPDIENAEIVESVNQEQITNAILKAAAQGDFRAYFLPVEESAIDQMTILQQFMTDQFDWTVTTDQSLIQLNNATSEIHLNDANVDAELMIIPGGSAPLTDQELGIIQTFVENGGNLIIYADAGFNEDGVSLATSDNLNAYLSENFGISFANDLVLDQTQQFESPITPYATDLDLTHPINSGITAGRALIATYLPVSIVVADVPPANVAVTPLLRSGTTSYAKTNLSELYTAAQANTLTSEQIARADGDAGGPFVFAAAAENVQTGARVVLFSSTLIGTDDGYLNQNVAANFDVTFNSIVWTTRFDEFFSQISVVQQTRPQDTPISADVGTLNNIRILTVFVLPFGILLIGVWVWWSNREKVQR